MKKILSLLCVLLTAFTLIAGCDADMTIGDTPNSQSAMTDPAEIGKHDVSQEALEKAKELVDKDGVYVTPAMVAAYIDTFNKLPQNFITKKEAQQLGWNSSKNHVSDVAPDKSIGGDRFGNYENKLPKGNYRECDINYTGGKRGAERIIYDNDGDVYYTNDHYNTFTQLFGE